MFVVAFNNKPNIYPKHIASYDHDYELQDCMAQTDRQTDGRIAIA